MANRVVLASAALGVTAYVANERYKDYQCLLEEQQEEERKRDAMERAEEQRKQAMERRFRQQRRKNKKTHEEGVFPSMTEDFGRFVQFYNMENRYTWTIFLNRLRDNAMALYRRNKNKLGLDLPLLEDQRNGPDEITFAAALALGDPQTMEMIIQEQNLVHMTPDLVLANITSTALYLIWREFEEYYASIKAFPSSKPPLKNMDKDLINIAFALISSHKNLVFPVNEKLERGHLEELQLWASKLGFHLLSSGDFSERSEGNIRYFTINYAQNCLGSGRKFYMMNFKGNFYVQLQDAGPGLQTMRFGVVQTRAKVKLLVPTEKHNKARVQFVAQLASMGMARVAARNIGLFGGSSASVEHICVQSGMPIGMLQGWRGGFLRMLDTNKASIVTRLKGRLEQCIPPPRKDSDVSIVKAEVSSFIDQYSRLLDLSYSVVPLLHGKPPSRWVPDKSVQEEAMEGIFSSLRAEQNRTRRCLEQDERERLVRSRKNMMPSPFVTASTMVGLFATFYWLSFCALHAFINWSKLQSFVQLYFPVQLFPDCTTSVLLHAASMFYTGHMLLSGCRLLQKPLSISGVANDGVFSLIWATTASLCEVISRHLSVMKSHRTPFEHELTRLKLSCQSKYQIWKDRCARQDFHDAIKLKRISPDTLVYLLEYYREDGARNAKKEEVRIPGSKTELDAFLEVKVIERDKDENANGDENADEMKSKIMALSELAEESNEKLSNLTVGTRVDVDLESSVSFDNGLGIPAAESSALTARRCTRGSVVASFGEVVHVLLDGESQPSAIPLQMCTVVQDTEEAGEEPTSPRTKFTFGETVLVRIESDRHHDEESMDQVGATRDGGDEKFQSAVATIVQTYGEKVLVLLDGDDQPVLVLAAQCSPIPRLKSDMEEKEPKAESGKPESDFERATTVEDAIRQGGWTLKRKKNHLVLERPKRDDVGGTQMATLPKTPSDRRAYRNALALLNRLNRENYAPSSDLPEEEAARDCMLCEQTKGESDFSKNQWKKPNGGAKCKACLVSL